MLKKILIVLVVLMGTLCGYAYYQKQCDTAPDSSLGNYEQNIQRISKKDVAKDLPPLLREINERALSIKSFVCDNVEIKVWQDNRRYRLTGKIHYEKPNNFHMEIFSILGKEADIGSNAKSFWYWSKRDKQPALYWADHTEFEKTRLKTPFNPMLMRASLGQELLDLKTARIVESEQTMMVVTPQQNASGQPILFTVFINKARKEVDGFVVSTTEGKYLASCEIRERENGLPKTVMYTWHEENRVMLMTFNKPVTNNAVSALEWKMPNYSPKINMTER